MVKLITIREATEAETIGWRLIAEHHRHLEEARVLFLFTNQKRKRCDRVKLGTASKLSALQRFLSSGNESVQKGFDFLILLDSEEWHGLTPAQRQALVDHELCHCWQYETVTKRGIVKRRWGLRGHDVEEFTEILSRHGFWKNDVREFGEVARQLKLPTAEIWAADGERGDEDVRLESVRLEVAAT